MPTVRSSVRADALVRTLALLVSVIVNTRGSAQPPRPSGWLDGGIGLGAVMGGSRFKDRPAAIAMLRGSVRIGNSVALQAGAEVSWIGQGYSAGCDELGCSRASTSVWGLSAGIGVGKSTSEGPPITGLSLGIGSYQLSYLPGIPVLGVRASLERVLHRGRSVDVTGQVSGLIVRPPPERECGYGVRRHDRRTTLEKVGQYSSRSGAAG